MNAANEVAVHKFLAHEIGYNDIYDSVAAAVETIGSVPTNDLQTILEADHEARDFINRFFSK